MKRYLLLMILLFGTALLFASNLFPSEKREYLSSLDESQRAILFWFFVSAPTLALCIVLYEAIGKVVGPFLKLSKTWSRLIAIGSIAFALLAVPFIAKQLLQKDIRTALGADQKTTEAIEVPNTVNVRFARAHSFQDKCDWTCRELLIKGVVKSYTAVTDTTERNVTYIFRDGGDCLDLDAFTLGFQTPGSFKNTRSDGKCIVSGPSPVSYIFDILEKDMATEGHYFGTRTIILHSETGEQYYQRSSFYANEPFPILGLIKNPLRISGNKRIEFGLSRRLTTEHKGSDQFLFDALSVLTGRT